MGPATRFSPFGEEATLLVMRRSSVRFLSMRERGLVQLDLMLYATCMSIEAYMTVAEAVRGLEQQGFTTNFELIGKTFQAVESGKTFTPDNLTIVGHHRFEGSSDPEEMAVVYAIQAGDGTRGVLVDAYGVYANPDLSAFLKDVRISET